MLFWAHLMQHKHDKNMQQFVVTRMHENYTNYELQSFFYIEKN